MQDDLENLIGEEIVSVEIVDGSLIISTAENEIEFCENELYFNDEKIEINSEFF
jgi:hypothetical protein